MAVSKQEAAQALQDNDIAQQRTQTMTRYRAAAPYFAVWGCVWLAAYCFTEFSPALGGKAWRSLVLLGVILSVWLSIRGFRQPSAISSARSANRQSWQFGAVWLLISFYFIASFAVLPPLDTKQGNAYISLFWAFIYALMGIWTGWRILTVGLVTAASILVGYFPITAHYFLRMGLVTGSMLILGGLWLRKV